MGREIVKWFQSSKGYEFISPEIRDDVFVHFSVIADDGYKSLDEGDEVEFEFTEEQKGPQAVNATKTS
ncbi:MAG: cold shock domain-containing protein [Nitrospiria bacterium]